MLKPIKNWWAKNDLIVAVFFTVFVILGSLTDPRQLLNDTGIHVSDKVIHALSYTVLMLSWSMVFRKKQSFRAQSMIVISLLFFGIIIELLQEVLTVYRVAEIGDVMANFTGIVLGWTIYKLLKIN